MNAAPTGSGRSAQRTPWLEAAAVLALAVAVRLAFVTVFPTLPISDFRALVDFGIHLGERSIFVGGWYWDLLNPGLPLVVALLTRALPGDPAVVMRIATALATAALAPIPVLLWRGAAKRARLTAAALLAVWPGQVAFSGVVAQDNWVLVPVVALGCLAVASLREGRARPVAAGLLYAAGSAVRQEMLVVLLPLALAAALGLGPRGTRARRLLAAALAAGVPLLLLAAQRQAATGRFALSTEHGGTAVLGSFVPGAMADGWADPIPHVAAVAPHLLEDLPRLRREAAGLALREALARPRFHAKRIAALTLDALFRGEVSNLSWSLTQPGVLEDPEARRRAGVVRRPLGVVLCWELALLAASALAAAVILTLQRRRYHWPLLLTIGLKVAIHALAVVQGRYFLAVTALMILLVGLGVEVAAEVPRLALLLAAVASLALATAGSLLAPRLVWRVQMADVEPVRSYSFALARAGEAPSLTCRVGPGRLTTIDPLLRRAVVSLPAGETGPGIGGMVRCIPRPGKAPDDLVLEVQNSLPPGSDAGVEQRVTIDGREVWRGGEGTEPGSWQEVGLVGGWTTGHEIRVELVPASDGSLPRSVAASVALELATRSAAVR